jgi:fatty acid desaturase
MFANNSNNGPGEGLGVWSMLGLALMVLLLCALYAALAGVVLYVVGSLLYIVGYMGIYYPLRKRHLLRKIAEARAERTPEAAARRRERNNALAEERVAARQRLLNGVA